MIAGRGGGAYGVSADLAGTVGVIFAVDRLPCPPLVSATMKTALILVGKRVGKAV